MHNKQYSMRYVISDTKIYIYAYIRNKNIYYVIIYKYTNKLHKRIHENNNTGVQYTQFIVYSDTLIYTHTRDKLTATRNYTRQ